MTTEKKTPIKYNTPFVFHFRRWNRVTNTVESRGGLTVVYEPSRRTFGIAKCSMRDMYCKKLGRIIALGRAKAKPEAVLDKDAAFVENVRCIAYEIAKKYGYSLAACGYSIANNRD